jgi:cytochrome c553
MFGLDKELKIINLKLMNKIQLSILSIGVVCLLNSCYYDNFKELNPQPRKACDTTNTITYQADIKSIFDANCVSCHSGGGTPSLADYQGAISSYTGEQLYKSLIAGALDPMPKSASPLSATDIAKIRQWIDGCQPNGAAVPTTCDTLSVMSYSADIAPILSANCTNGCHDQIGLGHSLLDIPALEGDTFLVYKNYSYLVFSLIDTIPSKRMPLGRASLSACQIAKIRKWVEEGHLRP